MRRFDSPLRRAMPPAAFVASCALLTMLGCEKSSPPTPAPAPNATAPAKGTTAPSAGHDHDKDHAHDHDKDHAHDHGDDHGHGPTTELGEQQAGGFTIKASRDGDILAGGEVPIDVWVTGDARVAAVRFWIGTQDGKGSMKAKAELEKDNWHTHAEIPDPVPAQSRLWIEIEADGGAKTLVSFDLRT